MNDGKPPQSGEQDSQALAVAVAGLLGQVGCVTLVLIGVALATGLWLDAQFNTRPLFTILLILGTVPVTLYVMVRMVLGGMSRLQLAAGDAAETNEQPEEVELGGRE